MTIHRYIGCGIYSVAEAARLTKVHPNTIRNWLFKDDNGLLTPDLEPIDDQKALSFHDLIEVLIAGKLRQLGISLQHVRIVHHYLKDNLDKEHPFCHQKLKTDGNKIIIEAFNNDDEMSYQEVISGQHSSPVLIEFYVKDIDYDSITKLAKCWNIHESIVIDPAVSFGSPVIQGTRISTEIIASEYEANDQDAVLIASLYDIKERDVLNAVAFEKQLHEPIAA